MMTRDEFEATLKQARQFGGFGLDPFFTSILSHDTKQRAEIERLRKALEKIVDVLGGDSACRLDHHGLCQEHFLTMPCEVAEAQQALKESMVEFDEGSEMCHTVAVFFSFLYR